MPFATAYRPHVLEEKFLTPLVYFLGSDAYTAADLVGLIRSHWCSLTERRMTVEASFFFRSTLSRIFLVRKLLISYPALRLDCKHNALFMSFAHFGGETTIQEEPQTYFGLKFQFWQYDISWKRLGKEYSGKLFGQTSLAAVLQDIAYAPDSIASGIS